MYLPLAHLSFFPLFFLLFYRKCLGLHDKKHNSDAFTLIYIKAAERNIYSQFNLKIKHSFCFS